MHDALPLLVGFALAYFGAAAAVVRLERWRGACHTLGIGASGRTVERLRVSGSVCAVVALGAAFWGDGAVAGLLPWLPMMAVAGVAVALIGKGQGKAGLIPTPHP